MRVTLNKKSDVPLHEQLAEQIVFLITTGKLHAGERLPSVRSFARQLGIHHNTVSKSYRALVTRRWAQSQRGSRLCVGSAIPGAQASRKVNLDELINQTIRRALDLGYSLQALRSEVLERLSIQPPDHVLVVEDEPNLRRVICAEIAPRVGDHVSSCTLEEISPESRLLLGAQVVAAERLIDKINPMLSAKLPCIGLSFASAEKHLDLIRGMKEASVIGVASISKTFLQTARGLLAPVVGRKHVMKTLLLLSSERCNLDGVDLAFCDSVAMPLVRCRRKIQYQLISEPCLDDIAVSLKHPMDSAAARI